MLNEVYEELEQNYEATVKDMQRELMKIRTGRANLAMLEGIRVDYYGTPTPLQQVGTMRVADPRMITIQPWEKNIIGAIEKAIGSSDLGLNPSNDGTLIRVPIPALSGERRQELVKVARRTGEDHKIGLRNHRRDANDTIREMEKESMISEDDMHRALEKVNQLTEEYTAKIDAILKRKEEEILEV